MLADTRAGRNAMSDTAGLPSQPPHVHQQRRALLWGARALGYVVYVYLVVTEFVLLLGFSLLLFGANPDPPFVQWAYRSLDRAMEPFRGIFTPIELGQTGNDVEAVLDTSVLFAMLVYGILAWVVHAGIEWLAARLAQLDREDREHQREVQRQQDWQRQQQLYQGQAGQQGPVDPPPAPGT